MNTPIIFSKIINYSKDSCKVIIFGKTIRKLWTEPITISSVDEHGHCTVSVIRKSVEYTYYGINDREFEGVQYDVPEVIMKITEKDAEVLRSAMAEYKPDAECAANEAAAIAKEEAEKAEDAAWEAEQKKLDAEADEWITVTKSKN